MRNRDLVMELFIIVWKQKSSLEIESDRVWTCPECGSVNDRDLLAANNIKRFGLEKKNLLTQENINKTPVVNREGGVELSALAGTVKRQNALV